jgi:hypothetical protein
MSMVLLVSASPFRQSRNQRRLAHPWSPRGFCEVLGIATQRLVAIVSELYLRMYGTFAK